MTTAIRECFVIARPVLNWYGLPVYKIQSVSQSKNIKEYPKCKNVGDFGG